MHKEMYVGIETFANQRKVKFYLRENEVARIKYKSKNMGSGIKQKEKQTDQVLKMR